MQFRAGSDVLRCSFCGKAQDKVKKLIAGPAVYICNGCVDICDEIIADDADLGAYTQGQGASGKEGQVFKAAEPRTQCSMCRTLVLMTKALLIPARGYLCPACEDAVRLALDESDALRTED